MKLNRIRAEPGIACIFGSPLTEYDQTVKNRNRIDTGTKNKGKGKNTGVAPFVATVVFPLSLFSLILALLG